MFTIEPELLRENNLHAITNRIKFNRLGILLLNFLSPLGAGTTTLLKRTSLALGNRYQLAIIDDEFMPTANAPQDNASQVAQFHNPTARIQNKPAYSLDAALVDRAIEALNPVRESIVLIDNSDHLDYQMAFDLGETYKIIMVSVTDTEEKLIRYANMFHCADLLLLNKIDRLSIPNDNFSRYVEHAQHVNPSIQVIEISALDGDGLENWYQWLGLAHRIFTVSNR